MASVEVKNSPAHVKQSIFHLMDNTPAEKRLFFNTYSMKQPDLYYFETIKMTSQAWSNFVWRIQAAGEYSL